MTDGMVPVASKAGSGPRLQAKMSSSTTDPVLNPSTADTRATTRAPSEVRLMCTIRSRAPAICSRTCDTGSSTSDMSAIVSRRDSRSRGELA
jgi:hypothetical protein